MIPSPNIENERVSIDSASEIIAPTRTKQTGQQYIAPGPQHTTKMDETAKASIASKAITQNTNAVDGGQLGTATSSMTSRPGSVQKTSQDPVKGQPLSISPRTSIQAAETHAKHGYTSTTTQEPRPEEDSGGASADVSDNPGDSAALAGSSSGTTSEYYQNKPSAGVRFTSQSPFSLHLTEDLVSNSLEILETDSEEPAPIFLTTHSNPPSSDDGSEESLSNSETSSFVITSGQGEGPPRITLKAQNGTGLFGYITTVPDHRGESNLQEKPIPTGLASLSIKASNSQNGSGEKSIADLQDQTTTSFGRSEPEPGSSTTAISGNWQVAPTQSSNGLSTDSLGASVTLVQPDSSEVQAFPQGNDQVVDEENNDPINDASQSQIPQEGTVPVSAGVVIPVVGISAIVFEYVRRRNNRMRAIIRKRHLDQAPDPYKSHFSLDTL